MLTPVAKAFSTDIANETTSLAIQVFGGMGYIEETGVAQLMRDARICAIYEGTNGIQSIDLVTRKIRGGDGAALAREIDDMRAVADEAGVSREAVEALEQASAFLTKADLAGALAGATPYLRLFALARGATLLAKGAAAAARENNPSATRYAALARFFADNIAIAAPGLAKTVIEGGTSVNRSHAAFGE
ncbi:MAG: acyl-CoA dehydrogenase family protein [Methylocystis sp.]